MAVRQLDNLIDINELPIPEAIKSDKENRAIGLGVMGFAETLEKLGMPYDSQHAWDFADRIFEFISYVAIDESADLAAERGTYKNFPGSEWSKGLVPVDTIGKLEKERGMILTVDKGNKYKGLDWDKLRGKVKQGMRNATLMAVAPNANIGIVAGTTPGIDPRFAQAFSRNKISGKYLDLNHNLVNDLKNMGIWDQVKESIIKEQGDISNIPGIPDRVKEVYKTCFTTSPYAFIEVAARAQKWVDQALSRNMYLETRDINETMEIYKAAWEKGLKSTYYLHMKPRHTAEQSTIKVNKAEQMGKRGFGAISVAAHSEPSVGEKMAAKAIQEVLTAGNTNTSTAVPTPSFTKTSSIPQTVTTIVPKQEVKKIEITENVVAPTKVAEPIVVGKIHLPTDPQEQFLCDSCQ
jgi:ribonucleoside-diphosphate reductase alpha chain